MLRMLTLARLLMLSPIIASQTNWQGTNQRSWQWSR